MRPRRAAGARAALGRQRDDADRLAAERAEDRGRGRPPRGLDREQREAQPREVVRHAGRKRRRRRGDLAHRDLDHRPGERDVAGERLVQHHAGGVAVGGRPDRRARELLGRHVDRRPDHGVVGLRGVGLGAGEPEVEQHEPAVAGADERVLRLDVAVDEARRVQRREPVGELRERLAQPRRIAAVAAAHPAQERLARDEIHREVDRAGVLAELAERDEVRMRDVLEDAELAPKLRAIAAGGRVQDLERDAPARLAVEHLEHDAEPTLAEPPHDLEARGQRRAVLHS